MNDENLALETRGVLLYRPPASTDVESREAAGVFTFVIRKKG